MSSFETPLAVIKDEKIVKNQDGGLKCLCLTLSRVNVTLDAKISFVPTHQLIVPSTLLAPATHIRTHKATNPQRYIRSDHCHMSYANEPCAPASSQEQNKDIAEAKGEAPNS